MPYSDRFSEVIQTAILAFSQTWEKKLGNGPRKIFGSSEGVRETSRLCPSLNFSVYNSEM